ncbi:hypothetical protein niasHS_007105 [Heterodera schachtii]|uniref:Uncharacterized protein n=1 Tax=Heterodera schachtii TaxID=97005 RepID=A0ABD2JL79_HETSC
MLSTVFRRLASTGPTPTLFLLLVSVFFLCFFRVLIAEKGNGNGRDGTIRRRSTGEEQQQTTGDEALDTAPPDVAVPQFSSEEDGQTKISDEFLRQLSAQQVADRRARLHRGGNNLRRPVDFEEALKMTVPYQTKKKL